MYSHRVLTIWPPKYFPRLPFSLCLHCRHPRLVLKWTAIILESKLVLFSILHNFARVVFPNAYPTLTCSCIKTFNALPLFLGKAPNSSCDHPVWHMFSTQTPALTAVSFTLCIPIPVFSLSSKICVCSCPRPFAHDVAFSRNVLFKFFLLMSILKIIIEFFTILLLFCVLVFWPWGMWDLSSPTSDWTFIPCIGRWGLNHWTTREVPPGIFFILLCCCLVTESYPTLATPWTVALKAASVHGISRQECWSGLLFPSPGDRPHPGIDPKSPGCRQILSRWATRKALSCSKPS